jgi:hypothetical protein
VVHDPTEFHGTEVAPAITVDDFMQSKTAQGTGADGVSGTPVAQGTVNDLARQQQTGY